MQMTNFALFRPRVVKLIIFAWLLVACSEPVEVIPGSGIGTNTSSDTLAPPTAPDTIEPSDTDGSSDGQSETSTTDSGTTSDATDGIDGSTGNTNCFCDDANPCTIDECQSDGSCTYLPNDDEACKPSLELFSPNRGAVHTSIAPFDVNGKAKTATGLAAIVQVGTFAPPVNPDGTFLTQIFPSHGINILTVTAQDELENETSQTRGILAGTSFYETTKGPKDDALIPKAIGAWLGLEVWDDDDTGDLDDFASIAALALSTLNVESLLPPNLSGEGEGLEFAWCTWSIDISSVQWTVGPVDLVPTTGGLTLSGTITDLQANVAATSSGLFCPDAIGTVTIATVTLGADLTVGLNANKSVLVEVPNLQVDIVAPVVDLTGGALSIFDFVFNWFNDSFAYLIESSIETAVLSVLAPTIQSALESFTVFETAFQVPELLGTGITPIFTVGVQPETLDFTNTGAAISLSARVTGPGGLPSDITSEGSLARGDCMLGQPEAELLLPQGSTLSLGLHDDLLNQVLFAGWWTGALHRPIPGQYIANRLGFDGISITNAILTPLTPPVATSCGPDGQLQLQIADLGVDVEMTWDDEPIQVSAFVSAAADIELSAVPGSSNGTLDLAINVTSVNTLEFDIVSATGVLDGTEELIELFFKELVGTVLDELIGSGLGANFPVPALELGTLIPTIPAGAMIGFAPTAFSTGSGYTVLEGALAGPNND